MRSRTPFPVRSFVILAVVGIAASALIVSFHRGEERVLVRIVKYDDGELVLAAHNRENVTLTNVRIVIECGKRTVILVPYGRDFVPMVTMRWYSIATVTVPRISPRSNLTLVVTVREPLSCDRLEARAEVG